MILTNTRIRRRYASKGCGCPAIGNHCSYKDQPHLRDTSKIYAQQKVLQPQGKQVVEDVDSVGVGLPVLVVRIGPVRDKVPGCMCLFLSLNRMVDSYKMRDMEALVACFAPDSDVVMYGTGADEKRVGLEEIRFQAQRDWDQTDSISMVFNETSVSAAGPLAWVASDGGFQIRAGGQEFTALARLSLVLEERNGDWLVVHAHFSVPAAGQEEGDSIPT